MLNSKHSCFFIRVNSTDNARASRGWQRSNYDDQFMEIELDDSKEFDVYLDNNGSSLKELTDSVVEILDRSKVVHKGSK